MNALAKLCICLHKHVHTIHEYHTDHGESTICNKMETISVACFVSILCALSVTVGEF